MAKPVPLPSLKKPSVALPVEAMAAFVSGEAANYATPAVALAPEPPALELAPANPEPTDAPASSVTPEANAPAANPETPRRAKASANKRGGRRLETRADGSVTRKVTVYLDPELDKQLSIHSVTNGLDRSLIVAEALSRYLKRAG